MGRPEPPSRRGAPKSLSSARLRESPVCVAEAAERFKSGRPMWEEQTGLVDGRPLVDVGWPAQVALLALVRVPFQDSRHE